MTPIKSIRRDEIAGSTKSGASIPAGIRLIVCMAARAMSTSLQCDNIRGAAHIFSMSHPFDVVGITARSLSAQVIGLEPRGIRTSEKTPRETMRDGLAPRIDRTRPNEPISIFATAEFPDPTIVVELDSGPDVSGAVRLALSHGSNITR
jgi:hypothetical protein